MLILYRMSNMMTAEHTNTHKHTFYSPLDFIQDYPYSQMSRYQNQSGFYWSKIQWVTVASAGQYANLTLPQTDNHTNTPPLSFFTGWMPFLPPNQQCQSTESIDDSGNTCLTMKLIEKGLPFILHKVNECKFKV